jgi:hypothetical protein
MDEYGLLVMDGIDILDGLIWMDGMDGWILIDGNGCFGRWLVLLSLQRNNTPQKEKHTQTMYQVKLSMNKVGCEVVNNMDFI